MCYPYGSAGLSISHALPKMQYQELIKVLGNEAESLLDHICEKIPRSLIHEPKPHQLIESFQNSDRNQAVLSNLTKLYRHGRLASSGYLSIFPVDQGVEHTAAFSFYPNPSYFDPETIIKTAYEAGCSGVTSSYGVLSLLAKKYADKIPLILKLNHSEHLTLPEKTDQIMYAQVKQAVEMGAIGVGATIYFGHETSHEQIKAVAQAFALAHDKGLFTILWCYPRNPYYQEGNKNYETAVDITAQAIHLGVTLGADIVKQKMPTPEHGFKSLDFSKYDQKMYDKLLTDHPIDLVRYQVMHAYAGRIGLLNSGGESEGEDDLRQAIRMAVINKRAGGQGIIMGRKVFKRPIDEGIKLLQAVQDVYLMREVGVA